jgi:hypothetical protein
VGPTFQLGMERGKGSSRRGAFLRFRRKPGRAPLQHVDLLGQARKAAALEGVGQCGGLGWANFHRENQKGFDF